MQILRLTLTEEQLILISQCLEDCSNFAAGNMNLEHTLKACHAYNDSVRHRLSYLKKFVTPDLPQDKDFNYFDMPCPEATQRKFIAQTNYLAMSINLLLSSDFVSKVIKSPIACNYECGETISLERLNFVKNEELSDIDTNLENGIKQKAKYRPFKNANECWAEMKKHEPFGWIIGLLEGGAHFLIICVRNDNYPITCNGGHTIFLPFDKLCNCYTFADGTPFGIKEK